jgi:hypothetical protein
MIDAEQHAGSVTGRRPKLVDLQLRPERSANRLQPRAVNVATTISDRVLTNPVPCAGDGLAVPGASAPAAFAKPVLESSIRQA